MNDIKKKSTGKNILDIPIFRSAWGKAIAGAAALVMFCTVYALILPAAAITGTEATEESGFYLENEENSSEQENVSVEDIQSDTTDITEAARIAESEASQSESADDTQPGAGVEAQIASAEPTDPEATEIILPEAEKNPEQSSTETTDSEINENENKDTEKTVKRGAEETAESAEEEKLHPGEDSVDPVDSETSEEEPTEASEDEEIKGDDPEEETAEEEEISEETEEAEVFEDGQLIFEGEDYKVTLDYSADARIPSNSHLDVREILDGDDYDEYLKTAADAVNKKTSEVRARLFDITILSEDEDGKTQEIQPQEAVKVSITYDEAMQIPADAEMQTVHIPDEGEGETLETEVETAGNTETEIESVAFETDSFSVFAVLYTVDFSWEVDGKTFEFSLAGGDSISLRELAEVLHVYEPDEVKDGEEEHDFSESIEKAEFSNRELVWVGKIDHDSTAKQIAEENNLEIEYSDELTDSQIAELRAKEYSAGEWVLLSVKPFRTEEALTVTMDTEEVFTITVTDSQIVKNIFTSKGESFKITVTFSEDEEIPDGTDIDVREILEETDEYSRYMNASAAELNADTADISFARFFDIRFIKPDGGIFEPEDPADVKIEYNEAVDTSEGTLKVVHFAEDGVEVLYIPDLDENDNVITFSQASFSITATIVSGGSLQQPAPDGTRYAVIIENPQNHKYYAVENDGSLVEVAYDQTTNKVTLDYPLEWTYISAHDGLNNETGSNNGGEKHPEWDPYNLRIVADAREYDSAQLPVGSYFRYISPVSESGIDEETPSSPDHGTPNGWHGDSLDGHKWTNGLKYENQRLFDEHWDDSRHTNVSNGFYIGADWENMRIVGRQPSENAAIVHMAVISEADIPRPSSNNETVSHIDIAISGKGVLDFPLAYGTYYYKDPGTGELREAYTVNKGGDKTLHLQQDIPVDQNDIMKAQIYAFDHEGNEVPNAYNITGYTSNQTSPYSPVQVRVEGSFKVTTLPPYQSQGWWDRSNDNAQRRADRLNPENQIFYQVIVNKDAEFDVIDPDYGQLYDAEGNPLKASVKMALSDGFGYWNERNECPPLLGCDENGENSFEQNYSWLFDGENINEIKGRNHRNWVAGAIIDNDWGGNPSYKGDSGMDFILGNNAESNPDVLAVEVMKIIEDEDGNRINPDHTITNNFTLFYKEDKSQAYAGDLHSVHDLAVTGNPPVSSEELQSGGYYSGYGDLRSFSINVEKNDTPSIFTGAGVYYDYRVNDGMYYVSEDSTLMQGENKIIRDVDGRKWAYKETRVETEYVWRDNAYNGERHAAQGNSAVPEVLGDYLDDNNNPQSNGFLEFYVYNVYGSPKYPIYVKKVDSISGAGGIAGAEFDVYGPYTAEETSAEGFDPRQEEKKINTGSIVTTDTNIKIGDFEEGIYYLYETKAPDYYRPITDPIKITVDPTREDAQAVSYVQEDSTKTGVYVTQDENQQPLDDPYYELAVENEPTDLKVVKEWADGQDLHTAVDVQYTILRIPYEEENDYDAEELPKPGQYNGILNSGNNWTETITDLPRKGIYTPEGGEPISVNYRYYVVESEVDGYTSITHGSMSQDGDTFLVTIINTPYSFVKPTEIEIIKMWQDENGRPAQDKHNNDQITVQLTQKKYSVSVHPITVNLHNSNGTLSELSATYYVQNGSRFAISPYTSLVTPGARVRGDGFDNEGSRRAISFPQFYISRVIQGKEVKLDLEEGTGLITSYSWGRSSGIGVWAFSIDTQVFTEEQMLSLPRELEETKTFSYNMRLSPDGSGTVLEPVENDAQGEGSGTGVWSGEISELPYLFEDKTTHQFYIYTYEVTEIKIGANEVSVTSPPEGFNGETGQYLVKWENTDEEWTITNREKPGISITVKKVDLDDVDKQNPETLTGAAFTLEKYTDSSYQNLDDQWGPVSKSDDQETGLFVFTDLKEGYYKLVETEFPTGYVQTGDDPRFRVKEENGQMVIVLIDSNGNEVEDGAVSGGARIVNENRLVIVGNPPGAALPSTGGPGTKLFSILGGMLILIAGALLIQRRRLI